MADARDNDYWLQRLAKDGHDELLARVRAGEVSMYQARGLAGYRKTGPRSPAARLSFHWKRANVEERKQFVAAHLLELDRVLKATGRQMAELKAKKSSA